MDTTTDIRPVDYVLAAVMVALAAVLGVANMRTGTNADLVHAPDSHSALMVPVFVAAAVPLLWRRRNILAVIGASFVVFAASVPMFGWVTRCGFALPLSLVLAYAVARFAGSRQNHLIGLAGVLALQVVSLMKDAATGGLEPLTIAVPAALACYAVGFVVQSRASKAPNAPTLNLEHVRA